MKGLRREEVALFAGVSVDYYARPERGDLGGASESVLEAVARALRLDDAERQHLHDLARKAEPSLPRRSRPKPSATPRSAVLAPGSQAADQLQLLATWRATQHQDASHATSDLPSTAAD